MSNSILSGVVMEGSVPNWPYPDHGGHSAGQEAYVPWRRLLQSSDFARLRSAGFSLIFDMTVPDNSIPYAPVFKRVDTMGRSIAITCRHRNEGPWRVTHSYCDHAISSTFDCTANYALAILEGRDNGWLFCEFPMEGDENV